MTEGQTDIGYDTGKKLWFLAFRTKNRWDLGMQFVQNANIKLKKVMADTVCWFDSQNQEVSHGRLRFYDDNDVSSHGLPIPEEVNISGKSEKLTFSKVVAKEITIKYVINGMMWEIDADGTKYLTRDLKGCMDCTFTSEPVRMKMHNTVFLHSTLVSIFGSNLSVS